MEEWFEKNEEDIVAKVKIYELMVEVEEVVTVLWLVMKQLLLFGWIGVSVFEASTFLLQRGLDYGKKMVYQMMVAVE